MFDVVRKRESPCLLHKSWGLKLHWYHDSLRIDDGLKHCVYYLSIRLELPQTIRVQTGYAIRHKFYYFAVSVCFSNIHSTFRLIKDTLCICMKRGKNMLTEQYGCSLAKRALILRDRIFAEWPNQTVTYPSVSWIFFLTHCFSLMSSSKMAPILERIR